MDKRKLRVVPMPTLGQQWQEAVNTQDTATQAKQEVARTIQRTREKVQQMIREGNKDGVLVIKRELRASDLANGDIGSYVTNFRQKGLPGEEQGALVVTALQGSLAEIVRWCNNERLETYACLHSASDGDDQIISVEVYPPGTSIRE